MPTSKILGGSFEPLEPPHPTGLGLSNVMVSFSSCLIERHSRLILAFASSDSPKSSIKIPYPERSTVEKKPMVTVTVLTAGRLCQLT